MWMMHQNLFVCDMCCHEGGSKLLNHSRIRRKGVDLGLEDLRAVGPRMFGTLIARVGSLGRPECMRLDVLRS